jgi:hypothetical protein
MITLFLSFKDIQAAILSNIKTNELVFISWAIKKPPTDLLRSTRVFALAIFQGFSPRVLRLVP